MGMAFLVDGDQARTSDYGHGTGMLGVSSGKRDNLSQQQGIAFASMMVVAKTEAAHQALSRDFAARRVDRAYAAFVWGVPSPPAGEITGNIGRSILNRKKMAVVREGGGSGDFL